MHFLSSQATDVTSGEDGGGEDCMALLDKVRGGILDGQAQQL